MATAAQPHDPALAIGNLAQDVRVESTTPLHYGDLRARATSWWAIQRARIRLTQAAGAATRAGWLTPEDPLSAALAAIKKQEMVAARRTAAALPSVYPVVAQLVGQTRGLGNAVALFLGLIPPLHRLEDFPGFPCPSALWAYCGLSAERRPKFDRRARMIAIAYLGTPALVTSPRFRELYQARRAATVGRDWQKMHAHRDAIRYVAKRILKYLWLCRLPVYTPETSVALLERITAADGSSSVPQSPDTLPSLENPHDGEASAAPELESHPIGLVLSDHCLSAPEPAAQSQVALDSSPTVAAPELDANPLGRVSSSVQLSAPDAA